VFYLYIKKLLRSMDIDENGFSDSIPKVKLKTIDCSMSLS
jgi:hypothetical protein